MLDGLFSPVFPAVFLALCCRSSRMKTLCISLSNYFSNLERCGSIDLWLVRTSFLKDLESFSAVESKRELELDPE